MDTTKTKHGLTGEAARAYELCTKKMNSRGNHKGRLAPSTKQLTESSDPAEFRRGWVQCIKDYRTQSTKWEG